MNSWKVKYKHIINSIVYFIAGLAYVLAAAYAVDKLQHFDTVKFVIILYMFLGGFFFLLFAIVAIGRHFFKI